MRPASRPCLQDDRQAEVFGRGNKGPRVFPSQDHETRHGIALLQGGPQNLGQRRPCHLNFAIIFLIPGIVST